MPQLNFIKATKKDLWDEIKRLEGEETPALPELETPTVCDGQCSEEARRFLKPVHAWPWRIQVGPVHVSVNYCPFCGRELSHA